MSESRYSELAKNIEKLIGGKDNVTSFIHCMTRLRFNVKDKSKVDADKIEKINAVIGTQWSGNQLQIIIGQSVPDAYALIQKETGLGGDTGTSSDDSNDKKFSFNMVIDFISGSIIPILPILIGCGFVKIIIALCSIGGILTTTSGTYQILNFTGDAGFYYLPVFIGYFAAKKVGGSPVLGMLLGTILVHPNFVALVSEGNPLNFLGINVPLYSYSSSVFPILLTVLFMTPVEKFFAKYSPETIRVILEPLLTILITVPVMLWILAPIGSFLGTYLSEAVLWLYSISSVLTVAIFAALYPLIVMTGMHTAFLPYLFETLAKTGSESFFMPAAIIASVLQGVAALAVAVKSKKDKIKGIGFSSAATAILSGVFEPALYGITLKYKKPLYATMIGGFIGGTLAGLGKTAAHVVAGGTGLLSLPVFISSNDSSSLWWEIGGISVGAVITFVITYVCFKDEVAITAVEENSKFNKSTKVFSPIKGVVLPLSEIKDDIFASGMMGPGVAIEPSEGKVVAPVDGEIVTIFPTGHAIGLRSDDGAEILIHIGMNTVELKGEGFYSLVKEGEHVKKGQMLLEFDLEKIQKEGYLTTTPVIITNFDKYRDVKPKFVSNEANCGQEILVLS